MREEHRKIIDELEDLVVGEMKKMVKKGDLSAVELKNATDSACLLMKLEELQMGEFDDEGYSESYNHGRSYRRGRSPRTGRYVSMGMNDGVSRHSINDRIVSKLEHMMDESGSDYERSVIAGWIDKIGSN